MRKCSAEIPIKKISAKEFCKFNCAGSLIFNEAAVGILPDTLFPYISCKCKAFTKLNVVVQVQF